MWKIIDTLRCVDFHIKIYVKFFWHINEYWISQKKLCEKSWKVFGTLICIHFHLKIYAKNCEKFSAHKYELTLHKNLCEKLGEKFVTLMCIGFHIKIYVKSHLKYFWHIKVH
jgi:hypothetical protein